ncbi:MAG: HesA/MoeB/ThiF family protein [Phycisphaerae bacterium]|jgi:adenylyltransferase/sulfurtransferase
MATGTPTNSPHRVARGDLARFQRQTVYAPLGLEGQKRLAASGVLIVGVGGLGSWLAELLARAGVGRLRLADDDKVDLTNIHRQGLYDEQDAAAAAPKVQAAAARLAKIHSRCTIEPHAVRLDRGNIAALAEGVQLVLDGTDNFATRFLLNDYCVKARLPWVFAGVVGAEGQVLAIPAGGRPCLRCVYDQPPPPCADPSCRAAGVLGPAVAALAALQAMEAVKILSGHAEQVSPYLTKLDLWTNSIQRIDAAGAAAANCPCCRQGVYEFLDGP